VTLLSLGGVEATVGDFPRAREHFERALEILERALGPDHIDVAFAMRNVASIDLDRGNLAQARTLYDRALAIAEKALGPEHIDLGGYLDGAANVRSSAGDHSAALALRERALAIDDSGARGESSLEAAVTLYNLGDDYAALGRYEEARAAYQRSATIRVRTLEPEHPKLALPELGLGKLDLLQEQYAAAAGHFERAIVLMSHGAPPTLLAEAQFGLAQALWSSSGDRKRARELATQAAELVRDPGAHADSLRPDIDAWLAEHEQSPELVAD
jgi:tetratricopeptide (TPR) repeat protein